MPRYYRYMQDRRWLKTTSRNTFSLYWQTSPTFSDISTPSSPPSSPPAMTSLDQQLREVLDTINGLIQWVKSLINNLNTLQAENQTLRDQPPAPAQSPFMPQPYYPSMFSPQPLPCHSPPQPSGSRPLPTPPCFSPSQIPLPQTPPAWSSFKDLKIVSPLPFSGKQEDTETFIHSCILYINGCPSEFGTKQNKVTWILSHMQIGSAWAWCEYIMAQIFKKTLWYNTADELLQEIQQRFSDMDKHATMFLKIHTMMQGDKSADEHVQDFEKAALEAGYEGFPLIVEFKRSLHLALRKRLSEIRPQPVTIQEWYNEAITIDRQWRISKAEEAFYRHRRSGMPLDQHTITMDKVVTRIGTKQPDQWQPPIKTLARDKRIPTPWMWTGHRSAGLLLNAISARSLGTWWKTVMLHSTYGIWHTKNSVNILTRLKQPRKTERQSTQRRKHNRIFPPWLSECTSTEAAESFWRA